MTGAPIWPIEERPVPKSDMADEQSWPTQPFPTAPPPFSKHTFTADDVNPHPMVSDADREKFKQRLAATFAPGGDSKLRAYDAENGKLLWTSPARGGTIRGGHSMYQIGGRQHVLVAVSGDTPPAGQWPKHEGVTPPTG